MFRLTLQRKTHSSASGACFGKWSKKRKDPWRVRNRKQMRSSLAIRLRVKAGQKATWAMEAPLREKLLLKSLIKPGKRIPSRCAPPVLRGLTTNPLRPSHRPVGKRRPTAGRKWTSTDFPCRTG
jgi:hypothetical protein